MAIKKRSSIKSSGVKKAQAKANGKTTNMATGKNPITGKEFGVFSYNDRRQFVLHTTYQNRVAADATIGDREYVYELGKMKQISGDVYRRLTDVELRELAK